MFDPEIPVDIYELGLIYKVDINDDRHVDVEMTLTAPGCPVAGEPQRLEVDGAGQRRRGDKLPAHQDDRIKPHPVADHAAVRCGHLPAGHAADLAAVDAVLPDFLDARSKLQVPKSWRWFPTVVANAITEGDL